MTNYLTSFEFPHQIASYECGVDGLLRPEAVLQYCQEAAERHANSLNFGHDWGKEKGLLWMLVSADVRIERLPCWKEKVIIRTATGAKSALQARRVVTLSSEEGGLLLSADLEWLLIDARRRRPCPLKKAELNLADMPAEHEELPAIEWEEEGEVMHYTVQHRDLDFYQHVNNASYLIWAMEQQLDRLEQGLRHIHISYKKESHRGESLNITRYTSQSPTGWTRQLVSDADGQLRVEILLRWGTA